MKIDERGEFENGKSWIFIKIGKGRKKLTKMRARWERKEWERKSHERVKKFNVKYKKLF